MMDSSEVSVDDVVERAISILNAMCLAELFGSDDSKLKVFKRVKREFGDDYLEFFEMPLEKHTPHTYDLNKLALIVLSFAALMCDDTVLCHKKFGAEVLKCWACSVVFGCDSVESFDKVKTIIMLIPRKEMKRFIDQTIANAEEENDG